MIKLKELTYYYSHEIKKKKKKQKKSDIDCIHHKNMLNFSNQAGWIDLKVNCVSSF